MLLLTGSGTVNKIMLSEENGMEVDLSKAKEIVAGGMNEAQELLKDSSKVDALLIALEERLKEIPVAGPVLSNVPLTISLVKSFITKEYTEVPVKVIVTVVSAFIYLVKRKDLVPDYIPVVGYVDDVSVLGFALKFCEPELNAYKQWRDEKLQHQAEQTEDEAARPDIETEAGQEKDQETLQETEQEASADAFTGPVAAG
jgi:uncharacterized membrane protein YkvA (DUF1232 family)